MDALLSVENLEVFTPVEKQNCGKQIDDNQNNEGVEDAMEDNGPFPSSFPTLDEPTSRPSPLPASTSLAKLLDGIVSSPVFQEPLLQQNDFDKITIAVNTEWIKCACGSLKCGVRFERTKSNDGTVAIHDDCDQPIVQPITLTWDFFGGTDGDRTHVGDTDFWQAVQKVAPSISSQQWHEFVKEQQPYLVLEVSSDDDEDSDEDDDDDEYVAPHAAYPDIVKSVLLLLLADRVLDERLPFSEDGTTNSLVPPAWACERSNEPIASFGVELTGHTWTRNRD